LVNGTDTGPTVTVPVPISPVAKLFGIGGQGGNTPPLAPAPGAPERWQGSQQVYGGVVNLSTGNLLLGRPITGWRTVGVGVNLGLIFNSQTSVSTALGPKWRHSYQWSVSGTSPAVVTQGDGRTLNFTLSSGNYTSPAGHYETLVKYGDGTWALIFKDKTKYGFDTTGKLASIADSNGNATTFGYSGSDLTTATDSAGRTLTLGYTSGKLTSVTDPESRVWSLSYDGSGRLYRVTDPALSGSSYFTEFLYSTAGNVTTYKNRLGKSWTYTYNASNAFTQQTNPMSGVKGLTFNDIPDAELKSLIGLVASTNPSLQGPIVSSRTVDENSNVTQTLLASDGSVAAVIDATGNQTGFTYDANYNVTSVSLPGGGTASTTYDARGNALSSTDATGKVTTRTYDTDNNLLTETQPGSFTTTNTYDTKRNLLTTTDPTGNTQSYAYNTYGLMTSSTDPAGKVTSYGYDSFGNRTSVTDPLGNVTSWTYTYDRVATRTDARSRTTTYSYDNWKRQTGIDYPTSTDQSFTYDVESRLTQAVDGTGTRTFTYDDLGRKTAQTDPRGSTAATYDAASRLLTQTDVTGRTVSYTYDAAGRLTYVSDPTSSASYVYDAKGRPTTVTASNGVKTVYTYDNAGRTLSLTHRKTSDNSVLLSYTPTYDSTTARLSSVAEGPTSATTSYTYDASGRLLTENRTGANPYASTYTYNSRGLRATAFRSEGGVTSHDGTYTYDNASRLSTVTQPGVTTENYTWWADGTLKSLPGNSGTTRNLEYDEEARMSALKIGTTTKFEFGYGYDGGRRWSKDLDANVWSWLPCGVACKAGELVELQSTLAGTTWTTASTNLAATSCGGGLVRSGSQFVLNDLFGRVAQARDSSGVLIASITFDKLGVQRTGSGSFAAGITRRIYASNNEDGIVSFVRSRALTFSLKPIKPSDFQCNKKGKCDWWTPPWVCNALKSEVCRACLAFCQLWCAENFEGHKVETCERSCYARYLLCMMKSGSIEF
jgi:YD repeat-containing protein